MRKKYLSIVVILITIILVAFMVFDKNKDESYIMVENQKENINNIEQENIALKTEIDKNIDNFILGIEEQEPKEEIEIPEEENKEENEDLEQNKDFYYNYSKKEVVEDKNNNDENIFIVDKNQILEKLSVKDKFNLMKLSKELSMNDYAIITESIKNDGEEECALEILGIVQKRLDKEDYKSLKGILEPYINIDLLEEKSL